MFKATLLTVITFTAMASAAPAGPGGPPWQNSSQAGSWTPPGWSTVGTGAQQMSQDAYQAMLQLHVPGQRLPAGPGDATRPVPLDGTGFGSPWMPQ